MRRYAIFACWIVSIGILLFATSHVEIVWAQAAKPIRIGVVSPHSPPGAIAEGSEGRDGIQMATDMLNEQGGVLGRKLELVFADTRGVPEEGRAAVERLITRDKVDLLVGGMHSSVCLAMIEVIHRENIPFMNVNCWSNTIRGKGYEQVWNTSVNNNTLAVGAAALIASLKHKRVLGLMENTDAGIGMGERLPIELAKVAPDTSFRSQVLDRQSRDFTPVISGLRQDPPDGIVFLMDCPGGCILINQLYQQGIAPSSRTWLFDVASIAELPDFWDQVKDGGKFLLSLVVSNPKMQVTDLGKEVRRRYKDRTGRDPSRLVFQGFDGLWALMDGVKRAGTTETAPVVKALERTKLLGTRGTITFNLEKGPFFQQWVDVPVAVMQFTAVRQSLEAAPLVFPPAQATAKFVEP